MKKLLYAAVLCAIFVIGGGCIYGQDTAEKGLPSKTPGQAARQMETLLTEGKEEGNTTAGGRNHGETGTGENSLPGNYGRTGAGDRRLTSAEEPVQKRLGIGKENNGSLAAGKQATTSPGKKPTAEAALRNRDRGTAAAADLGDFSITAYTAGYESTQKKKGEPGYGITATGTTVKEGRTIAADWGVLPPGTQVRIEGLEGVYTVEDRGGAVDGKHIDLYVADLDRALEWGRQQRSVWVLKWGRKD
jgi:3D (Asp-Asp-Asp) domain-containing protein